MGLHSAKLHQIRDLAFRHQKQIQCTTAAIHFCFHLKKFPADFQEKLLEKFQQISQTLTHC